MKQFIAAGKFTLKELKDKLVSTTRKHAVGFDNRNINLRYIFKDMVKNNRGKDLPHSLIASGSFSWATPDVNCAIPREFNIQARYQTVRDTAVMLCCYWCIEMPVYLYIFLDKHGELTSFFPCLGNSIMMDPANHNQFYMPMKAKYYALPDWAHKFGFIQDMIDHREPEWRMIAAVNLYVKHIVRTANPDIMAADLRKNLRVFGGKLEPVEEVYSYDKYLIDNLKRYEYDPRDDLNELKESEVNVKKRPLLFISPSTYTLNTIDREEVNMTPELEASDRMRREDYDGDGITLDQLDLLISGAF